MKIKNYFSTNLLGLLKEKNITQKKLANMLNTKESVISLWVTGKTKPSSKSLLKLAEIFDIPVGNLFEKKQNFDSNVEKKGKNVDLNLILSLVTENNKRFEKEIDTIKNRLKTLEEKNEKFEKDNLELRLKLKEKK